MLKNRIKEKISSLSDELVDCLIYNLFNVNDNIYLNSINKIQEYSYNIIKETIIKVFKEIDNNFKNSQNKIKQYNINKFNVSRTIITIVSELTLKELTIKLKIELINYFILIKYFICQNMIIMILLLKL